MEPPEFSLIPYVGAVYFLLQLRPAARRALNNDNFDDPSTNASRGGALQAAASRCVLIQWSPEAREGLRRRRAGGHAALSGRGRHA